MNTQTKIFSYLAAFLLIPFIIADILIIDFTNNKSFESGCSSLATITENLSILTKGYVESVSKSAKSIATNSATRDILKTVVSYEEFSEMTPTEANMHIIESAYNTRLAKVTEAIEASAGTLKNSAFYVLNGEGKLLTKSITDSADPLSGYNFAEHDAFISAIGGTGYNGNVLVSGGKDFRILVSFPIMSPHDIKTPAGAVIVSCEMDQLINDTVNAITVGDQSFSFVTDSQGELLVSNPKIIVDPKSEVFANIRNGTESPNGIFRFPVRNVDYICSYTVADYNGWFIATIAPHSAFYAGDDTLPLVIALSAAIYLVVIAGLFLVIVKSTGILNFAAKVMQGDHNNEFNAVDYSKKYSRTSRNDPLMIIVDRYNDLVQKQKQTKFRLSEAKLRYKIAVEGVHDVVWSWNLRTNALMVSKKWAEISELPTPKKFCLELFQQLTNNDEEAKAIYNYFLDFSKSNKNSIRYEYKKIRNENDVFWYLVEANIRRGDRNEPIEISGFLSDITVTKNAEQEIENLAFFDNATGLNNRYRFYDCLVRAIALNPDKKHYLIAIEINNFRYINDVMGYEYGDNLLKWFAALLRKNKISGMILSRFGGGEFKVLMQDAANLHEAISFCDKLLENLKSESFSDDRHNTTIKVSIGITDYPKDAFTADNLIQNADLALLNAKNSQEESLAVFKPEMFDKLKRRQELSDILKTAIRTGELCVFYQPLISTNTGKVIGAEALMRLFSKKYGFVSPIEFIPICEETGLINEIGLWCLKQSCSTLVELKEQGIDIGSINVNVSPIQFQDKDFIRNVRRTIFSSGVNPEWIKFEITESVFMHSFEEGRRLMNSLKHLGSMTALDDFGSGYSSLNYLSSLPIDVLKIDKSFIDKISFDQKQSKITKKIIELAHTIGIKVVAEGVEDAQQFEMLKIFNCDVIQGWFFSKALSKEDFKRYVITKNNLETDGSAQAVI